MSQSIWSILGLKATRDVAQIKRAYAGKLKAINLDADPAAFQQLREARDIAIRLAEQAEEADVESPTEESTVLADEPSETSADQPGCNSAEEQPVEEPLDPVRQELNNHHQALCQILFYMHGETFYAATPEEDQAMRQHFAAIAANPVLQDIDTLANASNWFAGAIAQMVPRSDVLIEPASILFGWDKADELAADPGLAAVMQRRADLLYRDQVMNRSHSLHRAWCELTKPADESSRRGWVRRKKVAELLSTVRSDHPTLEREFDWYRVSLWENQGSQERYFKLWPIGLLAFFALRICSAVTHDPQLSQANPSSPLPAYEGSAPLSTSEQDIDRAITNFTSGAINGGQLQLGNPALYQLLQTVWYSKKEEGASALVFDGSVRELLEGHLRGLWAYAPAELLLERFKLDRDIAKSQATASAEACKIYFVEGVQQLHRVHRQRETELMAKRILAIDPDAPTASRKDSIRFVIPGYVMAEVGRRTATGKSALNRAMSLEGDALTICKVRLALLDAVLDLPAAQRTKILRDMATD